MWLTLYSPCRRTNGWPDSRSPCSTPKHSNLCLTLCQGAHRSQARNRTPCCQSGSNLACLAPCILWSCQSSMENTRFSQSAEVHKVKHFRARSHTCTNRLNPEQDRVFCPRSKFRAILDENILDKRDLFHAHWKIFFFHSGWISAQWWSSVSALLPGSMSLSTHSGILPLTHFSYPCMVYTLTRAHNHLLTGKCSHKPTVPRLVDMCSPWLQGDKTQSYL